MRTPWPTSFPSQTFIVPIMADPTLRFTFHPPPPPARSPGQTKVQIVTSWAMYRGFVTLHTVGSLGVDDEFGENLQIARPSSSHRRRAGPDIPTSAAVTITKKGDGAAAMLSRVRDAFSLLHPLAARPPFYSPNKRFGFSLCDAHRQAIKALDEEKEGAQQC